VKGKGCTSSRYAIVRLAHTPYLPKPVLPKKKRKEKIPLVVHERLYWLVKVKAEPIVKDTERTFSLL
jgi:hypothetical protein